MCGLHLWSRHVECCRREKPIKSLIPGVLPKTLEGCSSQEQDACLTPDAGGWADPIGLIPLPSGLVLKASWLGELNAEFGLQSPHRRLKNSIGEVYEQVGELGQLLDIWVLNREPSGCG